MKSEHQRWRCSESDTYPRGVADGRDKPPPEMQKARHLAAAGRENVMDLIERLRERNKTLELGDNLCAEAANEIEQLRDLLCEVTEIADAWCVGANGGEVIDKAKAHLGRGHLPVYATKPKT